MSNFNFFWLNFSFSIISEKKILLKIYLFCLKFRVNFLRKVLPRYFWQFCWRSSPWSGLVSRISINQLLSLKSHLFELLFEPLFVRHFLSKNEPDADSDDVKNRQKKCQNSENVEPADDKEGGRHDQDGDNRRKTFFFRAIWNNFR